MRRPLATIAVTKTVLSFFFLISTCSTCEVITVLNVMRKVLYGVHNYDVLMIAHVNVNFFSFLAQAFGSGPGARV